MSKVSSSSWDRGCRFLFLRTSTLPGRLEKESDLVRRFGGRSLLGAGSSGVSVGRAGAGEDAGAPTESRPFCLASPSSFFSFAFFRTFTRSTMGLLQLGARARRSRSRRVDNLGVFAECVEQRGRRQGVDQPRNAAAQQVNLFHRFPAERIARCRRPRGCDARCTGPSLRARAA